MGSDLLITDDSGLACAAGGFHIDPWRPVPVAVVTHAHSDHARPGSALYYCEARSLGPLRLRLGAGANIVPVPAGESFSLGRTRVSFHPAGHILGSAQVRVEGDGAVWVFSGDYKPAEPHRPGEIDPDPTCAPFEPVRCDVFITEATFALPVYRWDRTHEVIAELFAWHEQNAARGVATILLAYALGKSQRLLAHLADFARATGRPVPRFLVHGAIEPMNRVYRESGIVLPDTTLVSEFEGVAGARRGRTKPSDFAGAVVIAPPSAAGSPWIRRFGADAPVAAVSGWMRVRGVRRRRGADRGFVLSDHADWPGLLSAIESTGARRVLITHGQADVLASVLRARGIEASALRTPYETENLTEPGPEGAPA